MIFLAIHLFQIPLRTSIKNNRNFAKSFNLITLVTEVASYGKDRRNHEKNRRKNLHSGIVVQLFQTHLINCCYFLYTVTVSLWQLLLSVYIQQKSFNPLHEKCMNKIHTISLHEICFCLCFGTEITEQDLVRLYFTKNFAMYTGVYSYWQA